MRHLLLSTALCGLVACSDSGPNGDAPSASDAGPTTDPAGPGADFGPGRPLDVGSGGDFDCRRLEASADRVTPGDVVTVLGTEGDESFDLRLNVAGASLLLFGTHADQGIRVMIPIPPGGAEVEASLDMAIDGTLCPAVSSFTIAAMEAAPADTLQRVSEGFRNVSALVVDNFEMDSTEELLATDPMDLDPLTRALRAMVLLVEGTSDGTVPSLETRFAMMGADAELLAQALHRAGLVDYLARLHADLEAELLPRKSLVGFVSRCGVTIADIQTADQLACWMSLQKTAQVVAAGLDEPITAVIGLVVGLLAPYLPGGSIVATTTGITFIVTKMMTEAVRDLAPRRFLGETGKQIVVDGGPFDFDWDSREIGRVDGATVEARNKGWAIDAFTLIDLFLTAAGAAGPLTEALEKYDDLDDLRKIGGELDTAGELLQSIRGRLQSALAEPVDALLGVISTELQGALGLRFAKTGGLGTIYYFEGQSFGPIDVMADIQLDDNGVAILSSFDVNENEMNWRVEKHNGQGFGRQGVELRFRPELVSSKWADKDPRGRFDLAVRCPEIVVSPSSQLLEPEEEQAFQARVRHMNEVRDEWITWTPPMNGSLDRLDGRDVVYTAPMDLMAQRALLDVEFRPVIPNRDVEEECFAVPKSAAGIILSDCCRFPDAPYCSASERCFCDEQPYPDECILPPECEDPATVSAGRFVGPGSFTWVTQSEGALTLQVPRHERWVSVDIFGSDGELGGSFFHELQFDWPPPAFDSWDIGTSTTGMSRAVWLGGEYRGYSLSLQRVSAGFIDFKEVESSTVTGRRYVEGEYYVEGTFIDFGSFSSIEGISGGIVAGCFRAEQFVD